MGAGNVTLTYLRWSFLPDRAFRLLVFMALVSLDKDEQPRYWGGRDELARALGRETPPEPAPADTSARAVTIRKLRRADHEAVKAGVRDLVDKGAVVVLKTARPGRNAEYGLKLGQAMGQGEPAPINRVSLSMGQGEPVDGVGLPYPRGGTRGTGTQQEEEISSSPDSPRAKLTYPQARSILSKLPDLGASYLALAPADETLIERMVAAAVMALAHERETEAGAS